MIYFVQAESGPIKIGYVKLTDMKFVKRRLSGLQCASWDRLNLIAVMVGNISDERRLHIRFSEHRLRSNGEWFSPALPLLHFIKEFAIACNEKQNPEIIDRRVNIPKYEAAPKKIGRRNRRLTKEQIISIRKDYAEHDVSYSMLADKFGCLPSTISSIVRGKTNKYVA